MNFKWEKVKEKHELELEKKINDDNKEITAFFEENFGNGKIEVPEEIEKTYFNDDPVIITDEGEEKRGWDEVKSWLATIPSGTKCQIQEVDADIDYISPTESSVIAEEDFDLAVDIKTQLEFKKSQTGEAMDPVVGGTRRHRRTCQWDP